MNLSLNETYFCEYKLDKWLEVITCYTVWLPLGKEQVISINLGISFVFKVPLVGCGKYFANTWKKKIS